MIDGINNMLTLLGSSFDITEGVICIESTNA